MDKISTTDILEIIIYNETNYNNAPATCCKEIIINQNREEVWRVLTDIGKWTSWNTEVSNVKLNGALQPGTSFDWKTGGAKIHSHFTQWNRLKISVGREKH